MLFCLFAGIELSLADILKMEEESLSPPSIVLQQVEIGSPPNFPNSPPSESSPSFLHPKPIILFAILDLSQQEVAFYTGSLTIVSHAHYNCGSASVNVRAHALTCRCAAPHMTHTIAVKDLYTNNKISLFSLHLRLT